MRYEYGAALSIAFLSAKLPWRYAGRLKASAPLLDLANINHGLLLLVLLHCVEDQSCPLLRPTRKRHDTAEFLRNAHNLGLSLTSPLGKAPSACNELLIEVPSHPRSATFLSSGAVVSPENGIMNLVSPTASQRW